jgi:TonB family protein
MQIPPVPIPRYRQGDSRFTLPEVIRKVDPVYTRQALEAMFEGFVTLRVIVGTDGLPDDVTVIRGVGLGLDESALECLKRWRFKPATRDGEPVPVRATVEVRFRLPVSSGSARQAP